MTGPRMDEGLWAWKQCDNNNHMIALQAMTAQPDANAPITLAYYGGSAFRITTPMGLTLLLDPWRNHPSGRNAWFLRDFPAEPVDIAASTHAHFDHDALHVPRASVILDRLIGTYEFADLRITGIADKHVSDSRHAAVDWVERTRRTTPVRPDPPDNWRSFDNSLLLIEAAGLRILHWGDNRPDPPDAVWARLGTVDIALLPIDGSRHVLSHAHIDAIIRRLRPHIVVPHHYLVRGVTAPESTLLPPDAWMTAQPHRRWLDAGSVTLRPGEVRAETGLALCFGDHVAFAATASDGAERKFDAADASRDRSS